MRTDRLQALADGVFAIAMTLLVLQLPTPRESRSLAHDLLNQWPSYAAYLVSFVTVAIVWINHHTLMDGIAAVDRTLMELTLLLLLFVSVVPWPTGLIAAYLRDPDQSSAAAVAYGLVMTLMASSFAAIWLRLARTEHLMHPELRPRIRTAVRRSLIGPVVYAAGTLIGLASAPVAFALYAFAALFFALSGRTARVTAGEASAREKK